MWFKSGAKRSHLFYGLGIAVGLSAVAVWYFLLFAKKSVEPGPFASNPRCSHLTSTVPETLLGQSRDRTEGAGAAAWGDGSVVMRCGVKPLPPTPNLCTNINGVDWVLDENRMNSSGEKVLTTYGRIPAVEVKIDGDSGLGGDVLVVINEGIMDFPQKSKCIDLSDIG
ncbi:DUF3515 family protein [Streptomyces sp. NPDC007063]|uniref:DUF3515 family protein n=1 Tax=Streptomyces sp. NPDC007063 TaxID=3364772 RepID=UPI00369E9DFC